MHHYRYQQYYKGYKVVGASVVLHYDQGIVKTINGIFYPSLTMNTNIQLDENAALQIALEKLSAENYAWTNVTSQENLRNRVATISYYGSVAPYWAGPPTVPTFATYYSYDLSGNVKNIVYDYPALQNHYQRYKQVHYDYDLVSGKVNMISYNRGYPDQYYQQYDYDADNRITQVNTSNDGLIWNHDANYTYYKHGPLAKVELGNQQVQSLEYAYTIQGWLKAINGDVLGPDKDMGNNGTSGDKTYARDVIAHALRYFKDDYKAIGSTPAVSLTEASGMPDLFNGNISQQTTGISGLGTMQRTYQYDQLQRLKLATNAMVDETALTVASPSNLFRSSYNYDKDGNITQLNRWDGTTGTPVQIDQMNYVYDPTGKNNKLLRVEDDPATPTTGTDLHPGQVDENYSYDLVGNLVGDKQATDVMAWDHFGKVSSIRNTITNQVISFGYDGRGNRIWKNVEAPNTDHFDEHRGEYYVRDAGGNILSVYRTHSLINRRQVLHGWLTDFGTLGAADPITPGGTVATEVFGTLRDRSTTDGLIGVVSGPLHTDWATSFTDKPISFYMDADPTLKSTLLYTGDDWIDALRDASPGLISDAFLSAGPDIAPLFHSTFPFPVEGTTLLEQYCTVMPPPAVTHMMLSAHLQYNPASSPHTNAVALFNKVSTDPTVPSALVNTMVADMNVFAPQASVFTSIMVANSTLFSSPVLRDNGGPWTVGIRSLVNNADNLLSLETFFDSWDGGPAALASAVSTDYKLRAIYDIDPLTTLTTMGKEATSDELEDVLTDARDVSVWEIGEKLVDAGAPDVDILSGYFYGTSGDTLRLAEHHLYGSSRLGVQLYDSTYIPAADPDGRSGTVNIIHTPDGDVSFQLGRRYPWYSYSFDDLIDSLSPAEFTTTVNGYKKDWETSRTLGFKYFELSDHLGNVLATVLDRKTGAGTATGSSGTLYDHWSADLATVTDYYPGGFIMPGRYLEHEWSRMGAQNSAKDDEVYGKGNFNDMGDRHLMTQIMRTTKTDRKAAKYPSMSPYSYAADNPIFYTDPDGETIHVFGAAQFAYTAYLQQATFLTVHLNPVTNQLTFSGRPITPMDYVLMNASEDPYIKVNMYATLYNATTLRGGMTKAIVGGAYLGSEQNSDGTVTATQFVNPSHMEQADVDGLSKKGGDAAHELMEAYMGAQIDPGDDALNKAPGGTWYKAHDRALSFDKSINPLITLSGEARDNYDVGFRNVAGTKTTVFYNLANRFQNSDFTTQAIEIANSKFLLSKIQEKAASDAYEQAHPAPAAAPKIDRPIFEVGCTLIKDEQ